MPVQPYPWASVKLHSWGTTSPFWVPIVHSEQIPQLALKSPCETPDSKIWKPAKAIANHSETLEFFGQKGKNSSLASLKSALKCALSTLLSSLWENQRVLQTQLIASYVRTLGCVEWKIEQKIFKS